LGFFLVQKAVHKPKALKIARVENKNKVDKNVFLRRKNEKPEFLNQGIETKRC